MFFFVNDTATTEVYTYVHSLALHGRSSELRFDAVQATAILGQRQPRRLDLARAGVATQLCYQFKDLCKPGGPNRMPLGFEATGRINRDTAAQSGFTALGYRPAIAEIAEAKILDLDDRKRTRLNSSH